MRTTITLDPDVDQLLRRAMRERGTTFRDTVNEAIRSGLRPHKVPPFRQKSVDMGLNPRMNWDKALQLASDLEDEEILRKMARGK
ncbi:MAG: antitoxin [Acidobacteriota bacterium]